MDNDVIRGSFALRALGISAFGIFLLVMTGFAIFFYSAPPEKNFDVSAMFVTGSIFLLGYRYLDYIREPWPKVSQHPHSIKDRSSSIDPRRVS